jgi:hypothetical protein
VLQDNYQVRTVAHAGGHVYAAFYRRKGSIAGGYNADVVVVRDDNRGKTMLGHRLMPEGAGGRAGARRGRCHPINSRSSPSCCHWIASWWAFTPQRGQAQEFAGGIMG